MNETASRTRWRIGCVLTVLFAIAALSGPALAPHDPNAIDLDRVFAGPTAEHPLGRDELGRDLLSRLLYGARLAFLISVPGVAGGAVLGCFVGLWCGYLGGIADRVGMRVVDALLAFPGFLLALVAAGALGGGAGNLAVAIGFFSFPAFARVARARALDIKAEAYVSAARVMGARSGHIVRRHILANALGPLFPVMALRMAQAIATASGLSFLGLGPPLPTADWGTMIDTGREYLWVEPRLVIVPGSAIFLSSLGFYLMGDAWSVAGANRTRWVHRFRRKR